MHSLLYETLPNVFNKYKNCLSANLVSESLYEGEVYELCRLNVISREGKDFGGITLEMAVPK